MRQTIPERIDRGELITAAEHAERFPAIPGMRHPGRNLSPPELDLGPRFLTEGVMTVVPPKTGEPYHTLVPAFDEDGNGVGGIRLPELEAPLGTFQGWNPRAAAYGAADYLMRFDGSFWPFPVTDEDRAAVGDPRRSVAARYRTREDYVLRVKTAVEGLVKDRILLERDGVAYMKQAVELEWPPRPLNTEPFWAEGSEVGLTED